MADTTLNDKELKEAYDFAVQLGKDAGAMLMDAARARFGTSAVQKSVEKDSAVDIVTETDFKVEEFIRTTIAKKYPSHSFIGEESYSAGASRDYLVTSAPTWIVDPLDGTVNFTHLFPMFCVSIGLVVNHDPVVGVINAPFANQFFSSCRGHGAWLNETIPLPLVKDSPLPPLAPKGCIFSCEWGKDRRDLPEGNLHRKVETFINMATELGGRDGKGGMVHGIRSLGSATLDLAYTAMGSFDIWWEGGCWEWDVAAGIAILKEAGGLVTTATPPSDPETAEIQDARLGSRLYLGIRAAGPSDGETARQAQERVVREVWKRYHNTPQAPRPATVIPAHIQPSQKKAYIPYPTFLLHGGSDSSTSHDDDLPWILISTSASEAPPRPSAYPKPRQHMRAPAPPQAQRPQATGPMRYCSQTFHEHRRLSRKPMSADLHSLYSLHSDEGSTSGSSDIQRADSFSGASRTSSSGCSRSDSNSSSRTTSSCYSNESVGGSSHGSSIDSLPSQQGRRREWRNSLPLQQEQRRGLYDPPQQQGQRQEWCSPLPPLGQMRQSDPLYDILVSTHSSEMRSSFSARRVASRMVSDSPPPPPPERNAARGHTYMPTPPEMSPRGILRFASSQRPSRKRVSFKREPELEESMGLQEGSSSEWEVLEEPSWAM
ncbi:hypothetical protein MCOR25_002239 [Pyricularia grisea]|nr:hypothetical protein MCOR25_002239 [Pyricularia grisea]